MGRFLPHPEEIPVELTLQKHECISGQRLHTISLGGVACNYHRAWRRGTALQIRMPSLGESACYLGYVAWCLRRKHGYLVGIAFVDEQTLFGARMGEQICQMERYRRQYGAHAQANDVEALALEWVHQHAAEFSHDSVRQAFMPPLRD